MKVLAIIPSFNEEKSLPGLLAEFKALPNITPLVIDDHSSDNTYTTAKPLANAIRLPINLGIGGAVQTGIKYAKLNGFDFAVQVDGDGQHRPDQISELIKMQQKTGADIVIGSRFITKEDFQSTPLRRLGITILRGTLSACFGLKVTDPTSGFRLLNKRAIEIFSKDYPQDFPEPISIAQASILQLKVSETPVRMRAREHGISSIAGWKNFSYMIRVVGYIILMRIGRIFYE